MNIELGGPDDDQQRQQIQGVKPDLSARYQAIGIPALTAATICKPKRPTSPAQQRAAHYDFED